jgi:hypothetical protein
MCHPVETQNSRPGIIIRHNVVLVQLMLKGGPSKCNCAKRRRDILQPLPSTEKAKMVM